MSGEAPSGTADWFRQQAAAALGQSPDVSLPQASERGAAAPAPQDAVSSDRRPADVMLAIWNPPAPIVSAQPQSQQRYGHPPLRHAPLPTGLFGSEAPALPLARQTPPGASAQDRRGKSHGMRGFFLDLVPKTRPARIATATVVAGGLTVAAMMKMNIGPADAKANLEGWLNKDAQTTLLFKTDCAGNPQAAFRARVVSTGSILARLRFYASEADAAKAKANPKDPTIQYFDGFPDVNNPEELKAAYVANLPKTPFTAEPPGDLRLPASIYAADLGFIVCTKPDAGAKQPVVSETGSTVTVDTTQLAIVITDYGTAKQNAYEMPTFTLDASKPGVNLVPADEAARLNAVFHPDPKDATKPNIPLLNSNELATLEVLNGSCAEDLFAAAKASVIAILNKQNGTNIVRPNWTGGFGLPTDGLKNKPADQLSTPDAKVINLQPQCTVTAPKEGS